MTHKIETLKIWPEFFQAALGNGADEAAWKPGEHWADAAARKIRAARGAQCTR